MRIGAGSLIGRFVQSASARRRRLINYAGRLSEGDWIKTVATSIDNTTTPPLVIDDIVFGPDGDRFAYYAEGGVEKEEYIVTFTVTTNLGEVYVDTVRFGIVELARG